MGTKLKWEWKSSIPKSGFPKGYLRGEETTDHPLKPSIVLSREPRLSKFPTTPGNEKTLKPVIQDPLSAAASEIVDPLSRMAAQHERDKFEILEAQKKVESESGFNPWSDQRSIILNKFTTSQKLSMATRSSNDRLRAPNPAIRNRLEQLDDFEEVGMKDLDQLTQQEYIESINKLNQELVQAWNQDLRVKALKIAIQCSKLLADTSVIQFYPSKFVLITDILDVFGNLVYERLWSKAEYFPPGSKTSAPLPTHFTPDMVPESAKETCRNWFYKISSIRELIPRLYVEAAILRSYSFLTNQEFSQALTRLTSMVRGIGDPLVAIYARCYLCRVGMSVSTLNKQFLKNNFFDFLAVYSQIHCPIIRSELNKQKVDMPSYLSTYTPALDWILQGLCHKASSTFLDDIMNKCGSKAKKGLLVNSLMTTFSSTFVATRAETFMQLIKECDEVDGFPQHILLRCLGESLQEYDVPEPQIILQEAWKLISELTDISNFVSCSRVWTHFIMKHCSTAEVNSFIGDLITRIGPIKKEHTQALQDIIITVVTDTDDFDMLFTMDNLLPLLDKFESEDTKKVVCRKILEAFAASPQTHVTTDPVTTDALMFIAKLLHDSVNALTVEDEKRQIGLLISQLIRRVHFGMDFEGQLNYYVEARATFTNLDYVNTTLVHCVNKLAMDTGRKVKSHHTRKTAAFVRACTAFSFITIPSISSEITKLQLYLLTSQTSLFNQCLGQADACVKAAISIFPEIPETIEIDGKPKSSGPYIMDYVCALLSTLIVVPDSPDQGILYLTRGLVNVLRHMNKEDLSFITKMYINVLDFLATSAQQDYPYHIKKVDSNDVLYGSDPQFLDEISKLGSVLIDEILNNLKALGNKEEYQKQSQLAFELFNRLMVLSDLSDPKMADLAIKTWTLAHKYNHIDVKVSERCVDFFKKKSLQLPQHKALSEILEQL